MKALRPLHLPTIRTLANEARKAEAEAQKRFDEHDDVDDMHERDAWLHVASWLEQKLSDA